MIDYIISYLDLITPTRTKMVLVMLTFERLAIIVWIAFLLTHLPFFKSFQQHYHHHGLNNKLGIQGFNTKLTLKLILFFSGFGILGTIFGIVIDIENGDQLVHQVFTERFYEQMEQNSFWQDPKAFFQEIKFNTTEGIINFRVMILTVAGLIGGPIVGFCSGLIVGLQRYSLSGFSFEINLITSIGVGTGAGLIFYRLTPKQRHDPLIVMGVCLLMELLRRAVLIHLSPGDNGTVLMELITLPMIVCNTIGGYVFMKIIKTVNTERLLTEEKIKLLDAKNKKEIAERLLMEEKNRLLIAEQEKEEEKQKRKHEEIKSLLLYMKSHFLMPILSNIKNEILNNPPAAVKQLHSLSTFTKKSLESINDWSDGKDINIEDEQNHIKDYLVLMKFQYPNISFSESYDDTLLNYKCSLFVLQPLVENAIEYGCNFKKEGDSISVSITDFGEKIQLSVKDNGQGMADDIKQRLGREQYTSSRYGTGMAFFNVIQRLQKIFNNNIDYKIVSSLNNGTLIKITIPKEGIYNDE